MISTQMNFYLIKKTKDILETDIFQTGKLALENVKMKETCPPKVKNICVTQFRFIVYKMTARKTRRQERKCVRGLRKIRRFGQYG